MNILSADDERPEGEFNDDATTEIDRPHRRHPRTRWDDALPNASASKSRSNASTTMMTDIPDPFPEPEPPLANRLSTSMRDIRHRVSSSVSGVPAEARWASLGVTAVLIVGIAVWALFIRTHEETMRAHEFSWERRIEVIDFQPRHDEGWSRPGDAYDVNRSRRIHHYDRVFSHYTTRMESYSCGTFDKPRTCTRTKQVAVYRDEPVYRWYYNYTVDRWRFARWITTGASDKTVTPFWADLTNEKFSSVDIIGNEQLSGKRDESYEIVLIDDEGDRHERQVSLAEWTGVPVDQYVTVQITATGIIRSVRWPNPATSAPETTS